MTTILAAAAVVLFAILIGIVVFFFFVYQREELENKKDEIKAQPGPYRSYTDVPSMHPDSCVSVKPFPGYTSKFQANVSNKIQDRIDQKANEVVRFMNERFNNVYDDIDALDTRFDLLDISHDVEILNADLYQNLDCRVRQIDRDLNGISGLKFDVDVLQGHYDSIAEYSRLILGKKVNNVIEDITFMKNDYEKRFENLGELSKDYTENLQSINDRLDRIEIDKQNDEEKAEWLGVGKND